MTLPKKHKATLEEFYQLREQYDEILEFIDGVINMSPSPTTSHQRISGRLHAQLFHYLDGNKCEVFHAPFDVVLCRNETDEKKVVVPDLSVICDPSSLHESHYEGAPTLIIEILSPSNQSHDLVTKPNLYMKYGVKEYWIVNPFLNTIQLYLLDDESTYQQKDIVKNKGIVQAGVLDGFTVDIEKLFAPLQG